ncbi:uncharacterized protein LOC143291325 [Babylonia areolata]|uniref:uncharacterized protein LOC143291325 n=1 Tax=Babylonia areolata TaxID=304850 RepID=UPI003FD4ED93
MSTSVDPVSLEDSTQLISMSTPFPNQSAEPFSKLADFLEKQNAQFVSTLTPTLCYLAFLAACGVAGNTLVFLVYYHRFKPGVTRTYILAMSVCDLMTNVLSLPADIVEVRFHNTFDQRWLCKAFRTVKCFLAFMSAFILVAVAFDRQRAICSARTNRLSVRHSVLALVMIAVSALAFTLPYSVLTGPRTVPYPHTNITGLECSIDNVFVKSLFLFIYNMISGLMLIICITLMLVSYTRIARQLWLHKKNTAIIMGAAPGKDKRKASAASSHTYTFEESSSGRARTSSVRSKRSVKAPDRPSRPDVELALKGTPLRAESATDSHAETAMHDDQNPNGLCSSSFTDPDTVDREARATDRSQLVTTQDVSGCGHHEASTSADHAKAADSQVHSGVGEASDTKPRGRLSSRSREVLSRICRTASDARSFLTRHKPTQKARGSVKKIPTRTTLMMFVLTVVFIVNYLPYLLLVSLRSRLGMEVLVAGLGLNGYHIALRSYFINSAVNPLVYSFCSARFRQECRRLCGCKN